MQSFERSEEDGVAIAEVSRAMFSKGKNLCLQRYLQDGHRLVDGRLVGVRLLPVPGEADLDEILLARGTLESPFFHRHEGRIVLLGEHIAGCFGGHWTFENGEG